MDTRDKKLSSKGGLFWWDIALGAYCFHLQMAGSSVHPFYIVYIVGLFSVRTFFFLLHRAADDLHMSTVRRSVRTDESEENGREAKARRQTDDTGPSRVLVSKIS